jgi:hypothetical protein
VIIRFVNIGGIAVPDCLRFLEENSSPGVEQTCGGEFKSWRGTDMWRRIQVLAWNRHVEENSSHIGGIAVPDCLRFLFICIYKYNANTYKNYIYSIKYRQITYIQNNSLIYLNFETYPYNIVVLLPHTRTAIHMSWIINLKLSKLLGKTNLFLSL